MQLGKAERQRLIESLVSRKRIGTQFELLDALADAGCGVTQATVSRDIRQLGLEKTHDPLWQVRRRRSVAPSDTGQSSSVSHSGTQVPPLVVQTPDMHSYSPAGQSVASEQVWFSVLCLHVEPGARLEHAPSVVQEGSGMPQADW